MSRRSKIWGRKDHALWVWEIASETSEWRDERVRTFFFFFFFFLFFLFRSGMHLLAETAGFRRYAASTVGIFSGTKQRGYLYRFAGQYGIYRPYRPVRYEINFLGLFCLEILHLSHLRPYLLLLTPSLLSLYNLDFCCLFSLWYFI